ncbi:MAG TPA: hypothetical protein VGH80_15550 [Xanthomonadaceae bacterium]|jgi:hypothetical protein
MRKILIALALAALTGTAFAQASGSMASDSGMMAASSAAPAKAPAKHHHKHHAKKAAPAASSSMASGSTASGM